MKSEESKNNWTVLLGPFHAVLWFKNLTFCYNWSYITWDMMKEILCLRGKYSNFDNRGHWNMSNWKKRQRWRSKTENNYYEKRQCCSTCTANKLNLTNMEKDISSKKKQQQKPTLKCHKKPAGTACLWSLSTPHELKQSVRKQVDAAFLPHQIIL